MAEHVSTQARLWVAFEAAAADLKRAPFDPGTIEHYVAARIACFETRYEPPMLKAARSYEAHAWAKMYRVLVEAKAAGLEVEPKHRRFELLAPPNLPPPRRIGPEIQAGDLRRASHRR